MNTEAQKTLTAISRKFFGGKNYNENYWFDAGSGNVYQVLGKGKSKDIGKFRIEPNGYVSAFPSVPKGFIEELNAEKDGPKSVATNKDSDTTEKVEAGSDVAAPDGDYGKEALVEKKSKKRRGRPKKS